MRRRLEQEPMTQGRNPMEMMPPGMEPGMDAGMPPDMPPMSPEEMQMMEMQDVDMMDMEDMTSVGEGVPQTAIVVSIMEGIVVVQDDMGNELTLPIGAFPITPSEGMELMQAEVVEVTGGGILVAVGPEKIETQIPAEELKMEFNPGDLFWMPAPPMGADLMGGGLSPDMPMDLPPEITEL